MPTDGRELLAAWKLPPSAYDTESVKVGRCIIGTHRVVLLESIPMRDFSMLDVAAKYGPDKFRISPGPGQYSDKSVTLEISEEYARAAGWASAPQQVQASAVETLAARTYQQAQQGPVDPVNLAAMVEVAVSRAMQHTAPPAADPFALMLKGFEMANLFQAKSMDAAKAMMGVSTPVERPAATFADVLLELGPQILEIAKTAVPAIIAATQPTPQQVAPRVINPPQGAPDMSLEQPPQQVPVNLPTLTEVEAQATAPIIAVMKPYGAMLADQLTTRPPEDLAAQLAGMLGPDLWDSVLALSTAVQHHGLAMFAYINPRLCTPAAGITLHTLAQDIKQTIAAQDMEP